MTRLHLTLFIVFISVYLTSIFFQPYPLSWLLKLLPIMVLLHFSWKRICETKEPAHKLFIIGLVFSAFGDFFLVLLFIMVWSLICVPIFFEVLI